MSYARWAVNGLTFKGWTWQCFHIKCTSSLSERKNNVCSENL